MLLTWGNLVDLDSGNIMLTVNNQGNFTNAANPPDALVAIPFCRLPLTRGAPASEERTDIPTE